MDGHNPKVNYRETANVRIQKNVKVVRELINELHQEFAKYELMARNGTGDFGDVTGIAYIRECLNDCLRHDNIDPE